MSPKTMKTMGPKNHEDYCKPRYVRTDTTPRPSQRPLATAVGKARKLSPEGQNSARRAAPQPVDEPSAPDAKRPAPGAKLDAKPGQKPGPKPGPPVPDPAVQPAVQPAEKTASGAASETASDGPTLAQIMQQVNQMQQLLALQVQAGKAQSADASRVKQEPVEISSDEDASDKASAQNAALKLLAAEAAGAPVLADSDDDPGDAPGTQTLQECRRDNWREKLYVTEDGVKTTAKTTKIDEHTEIENRRTYWTRCTACGFDTAPGENSKGEYAKWCTRMECPHGPENLRRELLEKQKSKAFLEKRNQERVKLQEAKLHEVHEGEAVESYGDGDDEADEGEGDEADEGEGDDEEDDGDGEGDRH